MSKNKTSKVSKLVLPAFLVSAGLFSAFLFPASSSKAVSSSSAGTELGATIIEYIRLALDTDTVTLRDGDEAVVAPSVSGTLATGDLNVAVTTNTSKGFSISVYTQDASTAMINQSASASIPSVSNASGYNASNGISSLATDTWGFRKKTGESGGTPTYGNWFGVGADETHGTLVENSNSSSSEYCATLSYPLENSGCSASTYAEHTLNFGANLTSALPAGTYTNNIIISAVAKSEGTTYTINFNANGGTGQMGTKSIVAGSTFTMPANTLITGEYPFLGYSFDANAKTATYEPGDIVTVNDFLSAASSAGQDIDNGLTLYLVWDLPVTSMQTFNSCATIPEGQTGTLKDSRDGQKYTVYHIPRNATYPDTSTVANVAGMCIMTQDLNLGAVDSISGSASTIVANGAMTLSPEDSNFTTPTGTDYEGITVPTTSVSIANGTGSWGSSNITYNAYSNKRYTTSGTGNYAGRGYYSWGAAMTVCPKGWRLPAQDEYNNNDSSYNASTTGISKLVNNTLSTAQASPWSFVLGGNYNGSFNSATSYGLYWSSTQLSSASSYYLRLNSSNGLLRFSDLKYNGFAVRCIAESYGYMQDFDSSSLAENESTTLIDKRDNHTYKVKKLPDGKVWMINNLTLSADDMVTEGKALTSANTNIPASDTNSYYVPPRNTRYATANSITNSAVATASTSVNFDTSYSNHPQVAYKAKGDTNHDTGNALPEDTAWYPFYTATLGFSYYGDGKTSGSSPRDICPKGWRLPKVSDNGTSITATSSEFANLARSYNSGASWTNANTAYNYYTADSAIRQNMIKGDASSLDPELDTNGSAGFTYAGYYYSSKLYNVGTNGRYWSSSVYRSSNGYLLFFGTSSVYPQYNGDKNNGFAVRCVAN